MIAPGIYSTWDARWTERYYDWAWHLLYVGFWSTWDCKKIGVPSRSLSASPAKIDCAGAGPHAIPLYFLSLKHIIIHNAWPFIGFPRPTVPAVPADWQMTDVLHAVHALWAPAKFGVSGSSPPPPGVSTENGAISACHWQLNHSQRQKPHERNCWNMLEDWNMVVAHLWLNL